MTIEVIETRRNDYVLEDVERRIQSLNEIVEEIVIGVSAVMKVRPKSGLPFLRLQEAVSIHVPPIEGFKVVLADAAVFWTRRKLRVN